jgi:D-hydroxyproline dehydrogenase subunit gamma
MRMPELISLSIDGQTVTVPAGATIAAAIAHGAVAAPLSAETPAPGAAQGSGATITRRSVSGMLRGPLCGMGVCHECRVTIDGRAHQLACQTPCTPGMQVRTALAEDAV